MTVSFDIQFLVPELILAVFLLGALIFDIIAGRKNQEALAPITLVGLFISLAALIFSWNNRGTTLGATFVVDGLAVFFKGISLLSAIYVTIMMRDFSRRITDGVAEAFILIMTATLGMLVLASARDFMLMFVGLETLTISMYILTAYLKTEDVSIEAGLKYLILGGVSSVFLLIGIALIYGTTWSTSFGIIAWTIQSGMASPAWCVAGMLFIFSGLGFKIASVPFHLWAPDVYQGAPTPVTAFLSVGSKAAGLVVAVRVFTEVFGPMPDRWIPLIAVLAAMTVCYGNLAALPQKNIKRLMGYSTIGHAGYLMMGLAAAPFGGVSALSYYMLAYLFTNLCVFMVIVVVSQNTGSDEIDDYAGLAQRSPFLAAALFLALLSLAGVPPLGGFFGKFLVVMSVVHSGMIWLALIGAVNVVISLYYYLMIVRQMYSVEPKNSSPIVVNTSMKWAIGSAMAAILILGIYQAPVYELADQAGKFISTVAILR